MQRPIGITGIVMTRSLARNYIGLVLLGLAGAISFGLLYDDVAPKASIDLRHDRGEIMEIARAYLTQLGYDLKTYQQDAWFGFEGNSHLYLQTVGGVRYANDVIRADSLSTHNWYVSWYDKTLPQSQNRETFKVWLTPGGKILGFDHLISDSSTRQSLNKEEAQTLAYNFLVQQEINLYDHDLKTSSETRQPNRLDHRFVWGAKDTSVNKSIWVRVQGAEVGGFRTEFQPGGEFQRMIGQVATTATFLGTASFAAVFLLFFFIVILFLKKYHEGEVGTRTALLVFIGLFGVSVLASVNEYPVIGASTGIGDMNKFNVRLIVFWTTVFIFYVFNSVMVFAAWSVGESSARSVWPGKLTSTDSALFRKFFTLDLGEGVLRGYAWGLALLGGYAAILYALMEKFRIGVYVQSVSGVPESYVPGLEPVFVAFSGAVFAEIVFRLFFLSFVKEKTRKMWLALLVSILLWCVTSFYLWDLPFGYLQFTETYIALAGFGIAFTILFLKYDLLTAITANFVIIALNTAIPLFSSTGASAETSQWVFLGMFAFPLAVAVGGIIKRQRFEFTPQTTPTHILRITERERMAKELEIARRVQMSLLPKVNPIVPGYDIAGICLPALEVGGDYYDFVMLGGRKMGIAIGDVSGKGVPAAIYMTLTKGILQSHAEDNISPKHVLSKVNSLMYRTIERNSFVSMFYAILDLQQRKIRFSRAGQCPVIVAQRSGEEGTFLTPKGMALGLENGKIFDSVLEEQELDLQAGEVLVFHTDGFTEAMNASEEEFGERRLVDSISRYRTKSAHEIIQGIYGDVQKHIADHPQHDDMTMVVVKVG